MTQYRIVKQKHLKNSYYVQRRILGIFWITVYGKVLCTTYDDAKGYIQMCADREKQKRDNPKDTVIEIIKVN